MADTILGAQPPAPEPAKASHLTAEEQADLDRFYKGRLDKPVEPEVQGQTMADRMYKTEVQIKPTLDRNMTVLSEKLGFMTPEEQQRHRVEVGDMQRSTQLPLGIVEEIHTEWTNAQVRDLDEDAFASTVAANNEAIRRDLRVQYGEEEAADLLERADRYVRSQPRLAKFLSAGTLGSNPKIVRAIVEHVRRYGHR